MTGNVFFPTLNNLVFLSDFLASRRPQPCTSSSADVDGVGRADSPASLASLIRGDSRVSAVSSASATHVVRDICWRFEGRSAEVARVFRKLPPDELEDNRIALKRLRHLVAHADFDTARGTYAGFLALCVLGEIGRRGLRDDLLTLLHFMDSGGAIQSFERFAASLLPATVVIPATFPELADPALHEALREARGFSATSPLAFVRFFRLRQILSQTRAAVLLRSKLEELADRRLVLMGDEASPKRLSSLYAWSQHDAYTGSRRIAVSLYDLGRLRWEGGREPEERRRAVLAMTLGGRSPREVTPQDVARAFEALGDPLSRRLSASLRIGRISLRLREDGANATYRPAAASGTVPVLQARRVPLGPSRSCAPEDVFFDALAEIVRCFRIHEDFVSSGGKADAWSLEYEASLDFVGWRAAHGDRYPLKAAFEESSLGPALYFRDRVEAAMLTSI